MFENNVLTNILGEITRPEAVCNRIIPVRLLFWQSRPLVAIT